MQQLFANYGKKGDILKASLMLFAERGYDAVSVRDIAKAAGAFVQVVLALEDLARMVERGIYDLST